MGIDIQIKIDLTPTQKRIMRGAVVTGVVVGALGIGLAMAAPHQWKASDPLTAADLNSLDIVTKNGKQYSLGATYCGKTASTNGQITSGYAGAKAQCEAVALCGTSPSAHMCTPEEMVRSAEMGISIDLGWISTGVEATAGGSTLDISDCVGWTSPAASPNTGMAWQPARPGPGADSCANSHPILCCD